MNYTAYNTDYLLTMVINVPKKFTGKNKTHAIIHNILPTAMNEFLYSPRKGELVFDDKIPIGELRDIFNRNLGEKFSERCNSFKIQYLLRNDAITPDGVLSMTDEHFSKLDNHVPFELLKRFTHVICSHKFFLEFFLACSDSVVKEIKEMGEMDEIRGCPIIFWILFIGRISSKDVRDLIVRNVISIKGIRKTTFDRIAILGKRAKYLLELELDKSGIGVCHKLGSVISEMTDRTFYNVFLPRMNNANDDLRSSIASNRTKLQFIASASDDVYNRYLLSIDGTESSDALCTRDDAVDVTADKTKTSNKKRKLDATTTQKESDQTCSQSDAQVTMDNKERKLDATKEEDSSLLETTSISEILGARSNAIDVNSDLPSPSEVLENSESEYASLPSAEYLEL